MPHLTKKIPDSWDILHFLMTIKASGLGSQGCGKMMCMIRRCSCLACNNVDMPCKCTVSYMCTCRAMFDSNAMMHNNVSMSHMLACCYADAKTEHWQRALCAQVGMLSCLLVLLTLARPLSLCPLQHFILGQCVFHKHDCLRYLPLMFLVMKDCPNIQFSFHLLV